MLETESSDREMDDKEIAILLRKNKFIICIKK